jgi:hypothetical protein
VGGAGSDGMVEVAQDGSVARGYSGRASGWSQSSRRTVAMVPEGCDGGAAVVGEASHSDREYLVELLGMLLWMSSSWSK